MAFMFISYHHSKRFIAHIALYHKLNAALYFSSHMDDVNESLQAIRMRSGAAGLSN